MKKEPEVTQGAVDFAAMVACGASPAGGPFSVVICDGERHLMPKEYKVGVKCYDHSGDEDIVLLNAWIPERQWDAALLRVLI